MIDSAWKVLGKPRVLGTGSLDILALLNGSRGSHVSSRWCQVEEIGLHDYHIHLNAYTYDMIQVIDDWVELSPGGGAVHVVVEYEPHGIEPQVGDIVFFEAFARSQRSLVFPVNEPMIVRVSHLSHFLLFTQLGHIPGPKAWLSPHAFILFRRLCPELIYLWLSSLILQEKRNMTIPKTSSKRRASR